MQRSPGTMVSSLASKLLSGMPSRVRIIMKGLVRCWATYEPSYSFPRAGRPTSHLYSWVLGDQRAITRISGCWATNEPSHIFLGAGRPRAITCRFNLFWVLGDQRAITHISGCWATNEPLLFTSHHTPRIAGRGSEIKCPLIYQASPTGAYPARERVHRRTRERCRVATA